MGEDDINKQNQAGDNVIKNGAKNRRVCTTHTKLLLV